MRTQTARGLEQQDRLTWAVGHLMLLTAAAERQSLDDLLALAPPGSPTFACAVQGGMTFLLRAAWAAARFGKATIPAYKRALDQPAAFLDAVEAALCLGAIGLRHAASMGAVRRILEHHAESAVDSEDDALPVLRDRIARAVVWTIDAAASNEITTVKVGQDFGVLRSEGLPEGHPLRFTTPEEVPEDLARAGVLSFHGNVYDKQCLQVAFAALPTVAKARAEDFYFPRDVVRAWLGEWTPDETLDRMRSYGELLPKSEPHRAAKTPGRNEPCHCGSGKKWKKCHGSTP
jgi:hypothetical protein